MPEQALLPMKELGPKPLVLGPIFVVFELGGVPGHKGRHRSRIVLSPGRKPFIQQYPDPKTAAYEATLAEAGRLFMRGKQPSRNPLALLVHSFRPIPQSWSKKDQAAAEAGAILPTPRPDGDNYLKVVQDALNKIVWLDDSQVVDARIIKRYSDSPAMRIEVREFLLAGD